MPTDFQGCFKTHPTPSALSFPIRLGFSRAVLQAPSFPCSPGRLFSFFSLFPFFPSLFSPQKLSGEQRGQPLRWHSLLTSPWGQAQLPEVSGPESIPNWGQSPSELERRQPQGWDRAHEFRRAPCWHHRWSYQEVLPSAFTQRVSRSCSAVSHCG